MSFIDLLKSPLFAIVAVGGLAATGGGAYYLLQPVESLPQGSEQGSQQGQSGGKAPPQATPSLPQALPQAFPLKVRIELDGARVISGGSCDMARNPQLICQVEFNRPGSSANQKLYLQRYPHDATRAMVYFEYGGSQDNPNAPDLTIASIGKGTPLLRSDGSASGLQITIRTSG